MFGPLNSAINFIYANIFWFQFLSLFVSGIMLGFIIYFNLKLGLTKDKMTHLMDVWNYQRISERKSFKIWKQIKKRLDSGDPIQMKLAILECDRLLDEILKSASFRGDNLDQRLKNIDSSQLENIEELRQVHLLKNRIVTEPDFELSPAEIEVAIQIYKRAFIDLGLLEDDD